MLSLTQHVHAASVGLLIECALSKGAEFDDVVAGTGISRDDYAQGRLPGSKEQRKIINQNLIRLYPVTDIAREYAQRLASNSPYAIMLLSRPTLEEAFRVAVTYQAMAGLEVTGSMRLDGDEVEILLEPRQDSQHPRLVNYNYELLAFFILFALERLAGARPLRLALPFTVGRHSASLYHADFGCDVTFGAAHFSLRYPRRILGRRLETGSHYLSRSYEEMLQRELVEETHAGALSDAVRSLLCREARLLTLEEVAAFLGMAPARVKSRMRAEGTTFSRVLNQELVRIAVNYLERTSISQKEIASRLGFSNQSNFRRSVILRTGRTPAEIRKGVQCPPPGRASGG